MEHDWHRTVHVLDAVSVRLPLSVAVTVTAMLCWLVVTDGAVKTNDQVPLLLTGVETDPRVVEAVTVTEPFASSVSVTVPLMVVVDSPSTVEVAVVNDIDGAVLATVPPVPFVSVICHSAKSRRWRDPEVVKSRPTSK